jgi:hypothetical protein
MRLALPLGLLGFALSASCVTINVYFPSAEAAEAADVILERVYGEDDQAGAEQGALPPAQDRSGMLAVVALRVLDFLVPPAQAQDFNISTPASERLQASLRQRVDQLRPFYESGAIGTSKDATVAIRDRNLIPLPDRNRVLKLVEEQSRDWNALYAEIARANGNPDWVNDIRKTFYERNVAQLSKGWWYQKPDGSWSQR